MHKNIAYYDKNFDQYNIKKDVENNIIIISDRDTCDLICSDITTLVFKDVTKKLHELTKNEQNNKEVTKKSDEILYNVGSNLKFDYKFIGLVKVFIRGYNQITDHFCFDLQKMDFKNPYKYSISDDTIEFSFETNSNKDIVKDFISTFTFKTSIKSLSQKKHVFIYLDGELIYDKVLNI